MIAEDYVSFETAKLLKERGFDERCFMSYHETNGSYEMGHDSGHKNSMFEEFYKRDGIMYYSAPTLWVTMKWLREKYNLHVTILWDCGAYVGKNSFCYHIDRMDNYEDRGYNKTGFDSSEEACEAAIKYCLENLI